MVITKQSRLRAWYHCFFWPRSTSGAEEAADSASSALDLHEMEFRPHIRWSYAASLHWWLNQLSLIGWIGPGICEPQADEIGLWSLKREHGQAEALLRLNWPSKRDSVAHFCFQGQSHYHYTIFLDFYDFSFFGFEAHFCRYNLSCFDLYLKIADWDLNYLYYSNFNSDRYKLIFGQSNCSDRQP